MKKRTYSPTPELAKIGACQYEIEIDETSVLLYRVLNDKEINEISKKSDLPWQYDTKNNRVFIGNVKTEERAVLAIKSYWNAVKSLTQLKEKK